MLRRDKIVLVRVYVHKMSQPSTNARHLRLWTMSYASILDNFSDGLLLYGYENICEYFMVYWVIVTNISVRDESSMKIS